ncbi:hypothetical protein PUR57_00210, partial [Streptomyces sp. JV176]
HELNGVSAWFAERRGVLERAGRDHDTLDEATVAGGTVTADGGLRIGAVPVVVDPGMGVKRMLHCYRAVGAEAFIGLPVAHVVRVLGRLGRLVQGVSTYCTPTRAASATSASSRVRTTPATTGVGKLRW